MRAKNNSLTKIRTLTKYAEIKLKLLAVLFSEFADVVEARKVKSFNFSCFSFITLAPLFGKIQRLLYFALSTFYRKYRAELQKLIAAEGNVHPMSRRFFRSASLPHCR